MVNDALGKGLPVPETEDEFALYGSVNSLIDQSCEENPAIGFSKAVDEAWTLLPKRAITEGMAPAEFEALFDRSIEKMAEETR